MQGREKKDYQWKSDADKEAKKQVKFWPYSWVVQHPKTERFIVLTGETPEDAPTRTPALSSFHNAFNLPRPEPELDDGDLWRMLVNLIDSGGLVICLKDHGAINSTDLAEIIRDEALNV
jgi:hypothetical protein